jgi:hypothetical protein
MWRIDSDPRNAYLLCSERIPVATFYEGAMERVMKAVMMALALVVLPASMVIG